MSIIKTLLIFFGFFIVSVLLTLPASVVLNQLVIEPSLKVGPLKGPWWSFENKWLSYQHIVIEDSHVSFDPSCLILGQVCFDINNEQMKLKLSKSILSPLINIQNSHIESNFTQINPFFKNLLVKPTGDLVVEITTLAINEQRLTDLSATVQWRSIGVVGEAFNLETVQAQLSHQSGSIKVELSDKSSLLDLSGQVNIDSNGKIDSNVQLKTEANFPPQIKSLLQSVMKSRGHNQFEIKNKQNISLIKNSVIKF